MTYFGGRGHHLKCGGLLAPPGSHAGMGFFRFLTEIRFFSEPFGSFLRSMQIRFNNFRGGGVI